MKSVKKFEFPASTFGQSTHNWDAILGAKVERDALGKPGPAVMLTQGEDFDNETEPNQFVSMIRNQAAKRHLKAKSSVVKAEGKPTAIYVQVCDMTDEEIANADARFESAKERGKQRRLEKKAAPAVAGNVPTSQAS